MHIDFDIDDDLIAAAMAATGVTTVKATIEEALRRLVDRRRQTDALGDMAGLGWDGDLAATREGREFDRPS
jgi:Arc/MetJ family transcription regulator